jgi:DNA-binding CsgD family transcriptional regulator
MTTKGWGSNPEQAKAPQAASRDDGSSEAPGASDGDRPGHAPSGVFRTQRAAPPKDNGWVLTDEFVREGFHYRLLRRPLELAKQPPRLTKREEAALELACLGHSNKSVAEELGVSPSTIGVLLFRAAGKLNAKSRSELLSNYEQFKAATRARAAGEGSEK